MVRDDSNSSEQSHASTTHPVQEISTQNSEPNYPNDRDKTPEVLSVTRVYQMELRKNTEADAQQTQNAKKRRYKHI